ncbi:MFS-type transporter SLC18B1-like [Panonychus citri]|uniref:MFS-type transporter SLC18B1-like n=1 Tax=Panonychus citri TaxID=50023 RepID=UPI002307EF46|nr:MFS-type transporter SLC18B1-like [Panonychus citri]
MDSKIEKNFVSVSTMTSTKSLDLTEQDKGQNDESSKFVHRNQVLFIFALVFANFAEASCFSLQAPFFPKFAEGKGATPSIYGLIFAILEVTILLSAPVYGKLVAYISCNVLMQFGLALAGVTVILFGLTVYLPSGSIFITCCFILRVLDGLGVSAYLTSSYSAMAKQFPDRIASVFGLLEVAFASGSTFGPTIGGLLYEYGGYLLPFMVLGSTLLIATVINHFCAPRIAIPEIRKPVSLSKFLSDFGTIVDLLSICVTFTNLGLLNVFLEPHLRQFKLEPIALGLIFVTQGLAYATASPLIGWIVDHGVPPKVMNLICCPISMAGAILLGPLPLLEIDSTIELIVVSLSLIGIGEAGRALCGFVSVRRETTGRRGFHENIETYGLITSTFLSCTSIGFSIGPSVGGLVLEAFGSIPTTFLMIGLNLMMALLLIINLLNHNNWKTIIWNPNQRN